MMRSESAESLSMIAGTWISMARMIGRASAQENAFKSSSHRSTSRSLSGPREYAEVLTSVTTWT